MQHMTAPFGAYGSLICTIWDEKRNASINCKKTERFSYELLLFRIFQ